MLVSIIIPVLNEESSIKNLLQQLQPYRQQGHEVIVVDGGSNDDSVSISKLLADKVIHSEPGRAIQMNNGVAQAKSDILWFLHADTVLPLNTIEKILFYLNEESHAWGRFNVKLSGSHFLFRLIEKMINLRSCLSSIATGDQGIFVKREVFERVGGYSNLPLMEDIELSKKLKKISLAVCAKETLVTSSRRWEKKGILRTVFLMWRLRLLYWLGISADKLARQYR
ncbi:MAG: TIGR04283 family arsenosugar biosynthesis glycosyltransferase [Gammaproteobacteria bacterium]|nr:TIGR04283 family arsenosugar biosynthesis glycosyltransferase [Gammaproteobacteria bacterium]